MTLLNLLLIAVLNLSHVGTEVRHDHHIGITEIRYAEDSQTYQITVQLFTHDLEAAILNSSRNKLRLGTKYEITNADSIIFAYAEDKFSIKADDKFIKIKNIGRETLSEDETFVYLETERIEPQKALLVKNTLLMEFFTSQTQIINVIQDGNTRSTTLSAKNSSETISL